MPRPGFPRGFQSLHHREPPGYKPKNEKILRNLKIENSWLSANKAFRSMENWGFFRFRKSKIRNTPTSAPVSMSTMRTLVELLSAGAWPQMNLPLTATL